MHTTPMRARILALAICLAAPGVARAQVWDEPTVTRLASERAPAVRVALARARMARASAEGEGLFDNPALSWERQEAFEPNAQTQDVLTARIPLDLSGRPHARRALADFDASLEEADAAAARLDAVAAALDLFYRALASERRVALLEDAQTTLDEAARVMERRAAQGEASGYAAARLALEAEIGRSHLAQARAQASASRERLGALLGADSAPSLRGELVGDPPASLPRLMERARERGDVASLYEARSAADRARSAADFAWVPRLEVEGGYNRQDGPVVGHGYAVGLSVEIPLFDHGQGERARAAAAHAAVDELQGALEARVRSEVRAAHGQLVALLQERARFLGATEGANERLLRAAQSGYREGERSLLELLDARRAVLESSSRGLALDLAVRRADIQLRRATGEL